MAAIQAGASFQMPKNTLSHTRCDPSQSSAGNWSEKGQAGQALIITAICAFLLMGFTGLAVDAGYVYYRKAWLKSVADGVALAVANARCLSTPVRIDAPGKVTEPDYDSLARAFLAKVAPEAKLDLRRQNSPWSVSVTLSIQVKAFFAKIFGVPVWNVSVVSRAAEAQPRVIGFSECRDETGGLRPAALIMSNLGLNNMKSGDIIDMIFEGEGTIIPTATAINPMAIDLFPEIAKASEWGFPFEIALDRKLRPIAFHSAIVAEGLKKSIGKSVTIAVFRTPPVVGVATLPAGFVRITPLQSSGPSLRARIDRTIKARPRLEI